MRKPYKPNLTNRQMAFINDNRHRMCIIELATRMKISQGLVRNYLAYYNLECLSGRGRKVEPPPAKRKYFNVDVYKGEFSWVV